MTEFKRVYFGTVLGYLWSLIRPLMLFGVLLFVFTQVFKVGSEDVEHYAVMLLLGIVLYTFFQEATTNAVTSVVAQEGVVRKTQFPRLVIPLSTVLTGVFNLGLNLIIVFVFLLAFGVDPTWTWLLFPFAILVLFVFTAAVSIGALGPLRPLPRRRDHLAGRRPGALLRDADPLSGHLRGQRELRTAADDQPAGGDLRAGPGLGPAEPEAPTAVEAAGGWLGLLPAAAIFVGVCVFGAWIFKREAPRIAESSRAP